MSNTWLCIPSIRPNGGTIPQWRASGYRVAVLRQGPSIQADIEVFTDRYLGWAPSINKLVRLVLAADPLAEYLVGGGDDTEPDPTHTPEQIARECRIEFGGSFCVMQPTGDKALWPGSAIDTFAGSPWMGREFCERMYGGRGPLFEDYYHMFGDQELQEVAVKLGVFWQRPDLIHRHMHWGRPGVSASEVPEFLREVNTRTHWELSKCLFEARRAVGFPGHEPLVMVHAR